MSVVEISPNKPPCNQPVGWPASVRRDVGALLEFAWDLSGSARSQRVHAQVVEGVEKRTGETLTSFYLGDLSNQGFIHKRLFSDFRVVESRRAAALAARKWIGRYASQADLLVLDVQLLYCRMLRDEPFLRIPHWIRQKYRVPDSWSGVLQSLRRNTRKTDLRKVRKYGFDYRITTRLEDFKEFYHRMHKPYLERRFDDLVILEPEWKFLRQCRKGELMQITRDGEVLAGVLLHRQGGRLAYVWIGVREDLEPGMDQGVFSALYYHTILYGYENGCDEIDFLGTRPVLNDGLFRYKRKWGTYVEDSPIPRGDILLRPMRFGGGVKAFLRENPFLVRDGDGLSGKVLLDRGSVGRDELQELVAALHTPGLRRLKVLSTAGFDEDARRWAAETEAALALSDLTRSPDPAADFCRF